MRLYVLRHRKKKPSQLHRLIREAIIIDMRCAQKKIHTFSEHSAKLFNFNPVKHLFTTGNDTEKLLIHNTILNELLDIREASVNLSL
jgi:hypothetical protein